MSSCAAGTGTLLSLASAPGTKLLTYFGLPQVQSSQPRRQQLPRQSPSGWLLQSIWQSLLLAGSLREAVPWVSSHRTDCRRPAGREVASGLRGSARAAAAVVARQIPF